MAVLSQANASVVVPGSGELADEPVGGREAGAIGMPASSMRAHMTGSEGATSGGMSASASSDEREREAHRQAARRWARADPDAADERAEREAGEREAALRARAVRLARMRACATSTTPNAAPSANDVINTVRTASDPSAPARDAARSDRRRRARAARARTRASRPRRTQPPRRARPRRGATEAIAATINGPQMKKSSCSQASSA